MSGLDLFAIRDLPFSPNCVRSDRDDVGGTLKNFHEFFFKGGKFLKNEKVFTSHLFSTFISISYRKRKRSFGTRKMRKAVISHVKDVDFFQDFFFLHKRRKMRKKTSGETVTDVLVKSECRKGQ